jgi:hypothetical protein
VKSGKSTLAPRKDCTMPLSEMWTQPASSSTFSASRPVGNPASRTIGSAAFWCSQSEHGQ